MLTNVPKGILAMTRNIVIRHPNTMNCEFYRRSVNRIEPVVGERQTIGGMMVLGVEDESEISWESIGLGYALRAEQFSPSVMVDRMDTHNDEGIEFRFLIEAELQDFEGGFIPKKNDVFYLIMGDPTDENAPRVAFEIISVETTVNVPPYVPRYICNRRDDLNAMLNQESEE